MFAGVSDMKGPMRPPGCLDPPRGGWWSALVATVSSSLRDPLP